MATVSAIAFDINGADMYWLDFVWGTLSRAWKVISPAEAQQNPYYGFRGWLLFFYLATLLTVVQSSISVFLSPDPYALSLFGGDTGVLQGVNLFIAVLWVPYLVLAPLKHPLTPKVWIGCIWMGAIVYAVALKMPGQMDQRIGLIALSIISASLMTWYVLRSKRVNVTYLSLRSFTRPVFRKSGPQNLDVAVRGQSGRIAPPPHYVRD